MHGSNTHTESDRRQRRKHETFGRWLFASTDGSGEKGEAVVLELLPHLILVVVVVLLLLPRVHCIVQCI